MRVTGEFILNYETNEASMIKPRAVIRVRNNDLRITLVQAKVMAAGP
jgi:hypothetical protein